MKIINQDVDINHLYLTELPEFLSGLYINGNFYCSSNQLTSLQGAPKSVKGSFHCENNQLTSLQGAPKSIRGDFDCNSNQLTSLQGAPESVGGDFYCKSNSIKFTEEQVRSVCKVRGYVFA